MQYSPLRTLACTALSALSVIAAPSAQCAIVSDLIPGPAGSNPGLLQPAFGQELYFSTSTGLHKWDPINGARSMLVRGSSDRVTPCCTAIGPRVFFAHSSGGANAELWASDGTPGGAYLVKEIRSGTRASDPWEMAAVDDRVFFAADDGVNGRELWVTDGTNSGTYLVKDIAVGSGSSNPHEIRDLGGLAVFLAFTPATGFEMWASDGTAAGTILLKDIGPGSGTGPWNQTIAQIPGLVVFTADNGFNAELWRTDGTPAGTVMIIDLTPTGSTGPLEQIACGDRVFFSAPVSGVGRVLHVTDGTAAGTRIVATVGTSPVRLTSSGNRVFFAAQDPATGEELWVSDGTSAGTYNVFDINTGPLSGSIEDLAATGNGVCFRALDAAGDFEPWFSDGTPTGTFRLCDIDPNGSSSPRFFTAAHGKMFFSATDPALGNELHWIQTPGAQVALLGTGGLPNRPTLETGDSAAPVLGTVVDVLAMGPSGYAGLLFAGPSAMPAPPLVPFMKAGCDWVGLLNGTGFSVFVTSQSSASIPLSIPNQAALEGAALNLQMVWFNAASIPAIQLSNGLQLVFGPAVSH